MGEIMSGICFEIIQWGWQVQGNKDGHELKLIEAGWWVHGGHVIMYCLRLYMFFSIIKTKIKQMPLEGWGYLVFIIGIELIYCDFLFSLSARGPRPFGVYLSVLCWWHSQHLWCLQLLFHLVEQLIVLLTLVSCGFRNVCSISIPSLGD